MASSTLDAVRLYRMDLPDHACPWGLRALRLLQERHIPFEDHRLTSAEEVEAFKLAHGVATTPQVFSGDGRIGGYTELAVRLGVRPEAADISYAPVVAVFLTAGLMALVLAAGLSGFMGFAICLLAMLKLMDVEAFAASFRRYDLLSQRWRPWGAAPTRAHRRCPAGGSRGGSARCHGHGVGGQGRVHRSPGAELRLRRWQRKHTARRGEFRGEPDHGRHGDGDALRTLSRPHQAWALRPESGRARPQPITTSGNSPGNPGQ
jgi:glutaredoxin